MVFCSDGFYPNTSCVTCDNSSLCLGLQSIEQLNRDIISLSWPDTCRVQDLGPKVSQLGSLIETELLYRTGIFYYPRITVMHPINISPYLADTCVNSSSYQRGTVITSTTF